MTQDEIIRMAREASNTPIDHHATPDLFGVNQIERFAALIAAHEREACAKVCEELKNEAVAKYFDATADECAAAIRARGEK